MGPLVGNYTRTTPADRPWPHCRTGHINHYDVCSLIAPFFSVAG